ncbi:MAG: tRNA/rRNA methyltransferase (SpoU) [Gemmatimonadetes bacterium]|nr:tRNA/rRNA methyltransferase (SpoU) [Gemmatimonadota bacterium]
MLPVPVHLVLIAPQDIVNVASAVRICRNFGIASMRVVAPEVELDAYRIEGVAHNTAEFISRIQVYDQLEPALADCVQAMVLTGRERAAKRRVMRPREAAPELLAWGKSGPVALVAGREDHGLSNEELDRCQTLVTISTDPSYTSLNLAQAIAVMCYELWTAAGGDAIPFKSPRREAPPATLAEHELLFNDWERTLNAIEFFKTRQYDNVVRSLRETLFRAGLDQREAKLFRAMSIEVIHFLRRMGVLLPEVGPPGSSPKVAVAPLAEGASATGAGAPGTSGERGE